MAMLTVCGFSVEGPRGAPGDAIARLEHTPRWTANTTSLVDGGARGLGGGLEYAVDASVCELRFVDGSRCVDIHAALAGALKRWQSGHPALAFTDVSDAIAPAFPLAAFGRSGQGAEIDFFAASPADFPPFRAPQVTGYTIFYERRSDTLVLSNGRQAPGVATIESADIRFNAARCYYIDPAGGRADCLHFPSVALHEIGHALAIAHPEEAPQFNLDTDSEPGNAMAIDCEDPARGLRVSPRYDGAAVAIGRDVQGPGRWLRGLTFDDQAARDALYPHCEIEPVERWAGAWGALAFSQGAAITGQASLHETKARAENTALQACHDGGGTQCRIAASFRDCFAHARGTGGTGGSAHSPRRDVARVDAVLACAEAGGRDCRVRGDICAFEATPRAVSR